MFLKEIFSILFFSFVTLVFSGFAIKVDKFEYTALTSKTEKETNNKNLYWLDMPEENFKKLKLNNEGAVFHYFEDRKEKSANLHYWDYLPINEEKPRKIKYIRVILVVDNQESNVTNMEPNVRALSSRQPPDATKEQKETTKIIKYFVETKSFWANLFC